MKTLIVKLGALGDVVRSTVLLRELEGDIFWLTSKKAKDLLFSDKITGVFFFEDPSSLRELEKMAFDLVISLDEEREILEFIRGLSYKKIIGIFINSEGRVDYTPDSSYWFDMSLFSKLGKERADALKIKNQKSVPQILVEMIGKEWSGQEYDLGIEPLIGEKNLVGLVNVSTSVWPNKNWAWWGDLKELLEKEGYQVTTLQMRKTLLEHIEDINSCRAIVCGDTLGMHLALALKKKIFVMFNCTPPQEIYDYSRVFKILSPVLSNYMYKRTSNHEAQEAIGADFVFDLIKKYFPLENE